MGPLPAVFDTDFNDVPYPPGEAFEVTLNNDNPLGWIFYVAQAQLIQDCENEGSPNHELSWALLRDL